MINIAILMTCHNRREMTLDCLKSLSEKNLHEGVTLDVYLVDDGSSDGTSDAVKQNFPKVNVIKGDGSLYWNQGMRLAWQTATNNYSYDFYFWLNDDTVLDDGAVTELLSCYEEALVKTKKEAVLTGACRIKKGVDEFSYGGRINEKEVIPNGMLQACTEINGNIVLVPKAIFEVIGMHSEQYTHGMGDVDYGLRAIESGFSCYTSKNYIATCPLNKGIPGWCNSNNSLSTRLKLLNSPKGLNMREYIVFRKRFWGWKWIIFAGKAYLKTIFPTFYKQISSK